MAQQEDKFTERARKVLTLAQEEAQRFNHNYIGTEHLLLGLVREGEGVAARVLNKLGVELHKVRSAVEFIIGRGDRAVMGEIGLTPRAKKVIELAVDEAQNLNQQFIGTEHMLLGLIRENESVGIRVLRNLGVDPENVRNQVIQIIKQSGNRREELGGTGHEESKVYRYEKINQSNRFEVFNESARLVLTSAQEEAQRFNHNYIGTEHILLGLTRDETSQAARILNDMGVELRKIRSSVEFIIGNGPKMTQPGAIGMTPRAKRVIDLTFEEARLLNSAFIGPEHILLGLVKEGEGIASGVLQSLNVTFVEARQRVKQLGTGDQGQEG